MKFYTGIGSRETPQEMLEIMRKLGHKLASEGWTLRSGAADGADHAFEAGWFDYRMSTVKNSPMETVNIKAEIYIPWRGFRGSHVAMAAGCAYALDDLPEALVSEARNIASKIHPAWGRCSEGAQKLHTRNVFQVLGQDLRTPSKMVICWALPKEGNKVSGGTATAWNLAVQNQIGHYNLAVPEHLERMKGYINGN